MFTGDTADINRYLLMFGLVVVDFVFRGASVSAVARRTNAKVTKQVQQKSARSVCHTY